MTAHNNGVNEIFNSPKDNKKHNTAITSRESFTILNNTGQRLREKIKVLEAIKKNQPITSRMLSNLTGIERTNITRSLFDLVNAKPPQVKEAFIDQCQETGRRVKHYTLIDFATNISG